MTEKVTVDAAIRKGRIQLFWIPVTVMFGLIIIIPFIISLVKDGTIWVPVIGFSGFILAIVIPFLYYFFMFPRWRIWAFSNVRNVHELKQRAILGQICLKDNSFWWKVDFTTPEQKRIIDELNQKFELPDVFEDDYSMPFETAYSYPMSERFGFILFSAGAAAFAVFLLAQDQIYVGFLMLAGGIIFGAIAYNRLSNSGPLLIISNDGITTKKNGFHSWKDIKNEQVFWVSLGKASYYGLSYEVNGETIKMSLRDLTGLSSDKVDHVLRTYRGRFEATIR